MRKLWIGLSAVAIVWLLFQRHTSTPDDPIDNLIVLGIAVIFAVASLVMILGTSKWSARALGLLLTSMGTSAVYSAGTYSRHFSHNPAPEWLIDLGRSLYIVGGPLLVYGLAMWVHANWGPPSKRKQVGYDGDERRVALRRDDDVKAYSVYRQVQNMANTRGADS